MTDLTGIKARLNHEPCCGCVSAEYGNCFDCRNTGCAHAPYIDNERAAADMKALVAEVERLRSEFEEMADGYGHQGGSRNMRVADTITLILANDLAGIAVASANGYDA